MAGVILKNVNKVFESGFQAVHDLSLDVGDGEFMILVGPSGCAKSTTLNMIAGLEDIRITSYNVCYTKLLRMEPWAMDTRVLERDRSRAAYVEDPPCIDFDSAHMVTRERG